MADPVRAREGAYLTDLEGGRTYFWCACGLSRKQPFCDGSHKGTGLAPMQYVAKRDQTVYFCACKHTKNQPLCDGAHSDL